MKDLISRRFAEKDDSVLWFSAADLDALGVDQSALHGLLDQMKLSALEDFDNKGGVIIAQWPELLEEKEHLLRQGKPITVYPVMQRERQEGRI
jgi:hypothetical protein